MPGQVSHLLDEEHRGTIALLDALEQAIARGARNSVAADPEFTRLVGKLREHLVEHVPRHFGFEEVDLFPRLEEAGEGDLCTLLLEEHVAINAVIAEIVPLASDVGALEPSSLQALKRGIGELAERLRSHIDKENMALLPLCDDHLEPATDQELAFAYASA